LEEGEDDIKSTWPLWAGLHTCYNGNYNSKQGFKVQQIQKDGLSSDYFLQLKNMKLESLIIANQHVVVNIQAMYTPLVTPWELALPKTSD